MELCIKSVNIVHQSQLKIFIIIDSKDVIILKEGVFLWWLRVVISMFKYSTNVLSGKAKSSVGEGELCMLHVNNAFFMLSLEAEEAADWCHATPQVSFCVIKDPRYFWGFAYF